MRLMSTFLSHGSAKLFVAVVGHTTMHLVNYLAGSKEEVLYEFCDLPIFQNFC